MKMKLSRRELKFNPTNAILVSDTHDSEDREFEEKKRQQYVGRWASQTKIQTKMLEATNSSDDLENESDVGALLEYHNRTRQTYINRWWARKPDDAEEEVASLSLSL